MALDLEFGRIRIPYAHDPETRGQSLSLIHELLDYPYGRTDDVLMALWFLKANLRDLRRPRRDTSYQSGWKLPARLQGGKW